MKKFLWVILAITGLLIVIAIFRIKKTVQTTNMLEPGIYDLKLNFKLSDIPGMLLSLQVPAIASLEVDNFSKNDLTIQQLKADIYTPQNIMLGSQDKPFSEPFVIKANTSSILEINYTLNIPGIIDMVANRQKKENNKGLIKDVLINYLKTGTVGEKVLIKGFVIPKELGLKVALNDEIEF